jgi:hypothetical protein
MEIELRVCDEVFVREHSMLSRAVVSNQFVFISNLRIQRNATGILFFIQKYMTIHIERNDMIFVISY